MRVVTRVFSCLCVCVVVLATSACKPHEVEIDEPTEERAFTRVETRAIQDVADLAIRDVRVLLPELPKGIHLRLEFGKRVIPETGETASALEPAEIVWTVDPDRDVLAIIRQELRKTLFHELHHLVRGARVPCKSLMDMVVFEGLATAFERDFGGANPPWGAPPSSEEETAWTRELLAEPDDAPRDPWLHRHPDGRRWIGMRVGTSMADRAAKASGRTSATMVATPTSEILRLGHAR
jgi:hypothetical protein